MYGSHEGMNDVRNGTWSDEIRTQVCTLLCKRRYVYVANSLPSTTPKLNTSLRFTLVYRAAKSKVGRRA